MLDILKRRLSAAIGKFEWNGEAIWLKRLSSGSWLKIQSLASDEADNDPAKGIAFYVELLALTLCDESGKCDCDSDEGRETLRQLGLGDLQQLGQLSLTHSGIGEQGKN